MRGTSGRVCRNAHRFDGSTNRKKNKSKREEENFFRGIVISSRALSVVPKEQSRRVGRARRLSIEDIAEHFPLFESVSLGCKPLFVR